MEAFIEILKHSLMITAFVFVMMLIIEYINILTNGQWQERLAGNRWGQYLLAALLGATPGCLGVFMVVALYSHRIISIGALVTAMIATSGDESFVMLAMIPKDAILLFGILSIVGIITGITTDLLMSRIKSDRILSGKNLEIHIDQECNCFPRGFILHQWKNCSISRGVLFITLFSFLLLFISGELGPQQWNWIKITILFVMFIALFIVSTVPDHFLEEHLWEHVAKKHTLRIFLWTFGAFLIIHLITDYFHLGGFIKEGKCSLMIISGLVGLIPESGPHMFFVTMYSKGLIPFSILLVSSIVQDGHGMLPLLAHSRKDFVLVKLINLIAGFIFGIIAVIIGY